MVDSASENSHLVENYRLAVVFIVDFSAVKVGKSGFAASRLEQRQQKTLPQIAGSGYVPKMFQRGGCRMASIVDQRLDRMIEIADLTGLTLDDVVKHIGRADQKTFRAFSDNPSSLPRYIASSVSP